MQFANLVCSFVICLLVTPVLMQFHHHHHDHHSTSRNKELLSTSSSSILENHNPESSLETLNSIEQRSSDDTIINKSHQLETASGHQLQRVYKQNDLNYILYGTENRLDSHVIELENILRDSRAYKYKNSNTFIKNGPLSGGGFLANLMANNPAVKFSQTLPDDDNPSIYQPPSKPVWQVVVAGGQPDQNGQVPLKIYGDGTESKFPPFIETVIQRVQSYFSTYVHEDLSRPGITGDPNDMNLSSSSVNVTDNVSNGTISDAVPLSDEPFVSEENFSDESLESSWPEITTLESTTRFTETDGTTNDGTDATTVADEFKITTWIPNLEAKTNTTSLENSDEGDEDGADWIVVNRKN